MQEYLITSSVEPIKKGRAYEELPLHVTIQQDFIVPQETVFINAFQNYVTTLQPFEVTGGEEDLFGPNDDIPVRKLAKIGKLGVLHKATTDMIERYGGELLHPSWSADKFVPHMTNTQAISLGLSETRTLHSLELIKRTDQGRKIAVCVLGMRSIR